MKAVIPAAGFGTRFLPFTKSVPKELIPIVDKPVIQYVVEEAVEAGAEEILIIISAGKEAICRHFSRDFELEQRLEETGKTTLLAELRAIGKEAKIHYRYQHELNGLGDAVNLAREFVGNEPFAVLLGDNISSGERGMLSELMDVYREKHAPVVAVEEVPPEKVNRYGIVSGTPVRDRLMKLNALVEKPSPETAPSHLAVCSRYILTPDIFDELDRTPRGRNGEIQLTDAMNSSAAKHDFYALQVQAKRCDAGDKGSFLSTTIEFAARRDEFRDVLVRAFRGLHLS